MDLEFATFILSFYNLKTLQQSRRRLPIILHMLVRSKPILTGSCASFWQAQHLFFESVALRVSACGATGAAWGDRWTSGQRRLW